MYVPALLLPHDIADNLAVQLGEHARERLDDDGVFLRLDEAGLLGFYARADGGVGGALGPPAACVGAVVSGRVGGGGGGGAARWVLQGLLAVDLVLAWEALVGAALLGRLCVVGC